MRTLDVNAVRKWAARMVHELTLERATIDRINVFPVADGDTGTNLLHTARAAWQAAASARTDSLGELLTMLAKGAVTGARGNSGVLLAQAVRGLAEALSDEETVDGAAWAQALQSAWRSAAAAVAEPTSGTLLSVLAAAADAASAAAGYADGAAQRPAPEHVLGLASDPDGDAVEDGSRVPLHRVVHAATEAAVTALAATPEQLPVLGGSGVVDAGGRGLVVVLDTLHSVVRGDRVAWALPEGTALDTPAEPGLGQYAYEVMYLVSGVTPSGAEVLRQQLAELGDCVSVAYDGAREWAVHVHCDDIGPAIEAGIEAGHVRSIHVTRFADQSADQFADQPADTTADYLVLACTASAQVAELFTAEGAHAVRVPTGNRVDGTVLSDTRAGDTGAGDTGVDELCAAVHACDAQHVVLLPNAPELAAAAEEAARRVGDAGCDVVVVPTVSPVQGLAAVAVHDPSRRHASDQIAMAEAAAATRRAELLIATSEALTWVGRCAPGDVLGLIDGEVVLIAQDVVTGTRELLGRALAPGGELVTALLGRCELAEEVRTHLRRTHPEVECTTHAATDLDAVLVLGVEQ